jgi:hypothetical protein
MKEYAVKIAIMKEQIGNVNLENFNHILVLSAAIQYFNTFFHLFFSLLLYLSKCSF